MFRSRYASVPILRFPPMSLSLFTCSLLGCGEGAGPVQRKWATLCRADRRKSLDLPRFHTAMRHNPGHGIMAELMEDGPVPVDWLKESRRRGNLDVVRAWDVEGAVAADADIGAGRAAQRLGLVQD